jgi:PAS domain S-box-containing protein
LLNDAIFESTQDAISVVDESGNGVMVNSAYTRVTGLRQEEVVGKPCTVDIASGESIHMAVLRTGKAVRDQRLRVGPYRRDVIVDANPIVVDGEMRGSVAVIKDVSELRRLHDQLEDARATIRKLEARYTFDDVIGDEPSFLEAMRKARTAAGTPATVLLHGESGTGKELFAHAIHNASERRNARFLRVNCAALTEGLLESELFGYVGGAFTGARRDGRRGLFEEAHGGTLFLDEVGLMTVNTQAKLLRVLQEHEVRRVGGTNAIPVDVRVIAATNLDLQEQIGRGLFREDLYYRLLVVPVTIPSLRERPRGHSAPRRLSPREDQQRVRASGPPHRRGGDPIADQLPLARQRSGTRKRPSPRGCGDGCGGDGDASGPPPAPRQRKGAFRVYRWARWDRTSRGRLPPGMTQLPHRQERKDRADGTLLSASLPTPKPRIFERYSPAATAIGRDAHPCWE